jgi:hypothetical protein
MLTLHEAKIKVERHCKPIQHIVVTDALVTLNVSSHDESVPPLEAVRSLYDFV